MSTPTQVSNEHLDVILRLDDETFDAIQQLRNLRARKLKARLSIERLIRQDFDGQQLIKDIEHCDRQEREIRTKLL